MKNTIIVGLILILTSCQEFHYWTEQQKNDFEKECSQQTLFDVGDISFYGFEFEEIDTITVVEIVNSKPIDTLTMYSKKLSEKFDLERKHHSVDPNFQFNINHNYDFYLENDKPYKLANIKSVMWPQVSMNSEGWGCDISSYTIDDSLITDMRMINFQKRGFKFDWEN